MSGGMRFGIPNFTFPFPCLLAPLTHLLALDYLLHTRFLLRSFTRSLTHSLPSSLKRDWKAWNERVSTSVSSSVMASMTRSQIAGNLHLQETHFINLHIFHKRSLDLTIYVFLVTLLKNDAKWSFVSLLYNFLTISWKSTFYWFSALRGNCLVK